MKIEACIVYSLLVFQVSAQHAGQGNSNQGRIRDQHDHWIIGIDPVNGITHLGLDSEETGKAEKNLLIDPVRLTWDGCNEKKFPWKKISENNYETIAKSANGQGFIKWSVSGNGSDMLWEIGYSGKESINHLRIEIPVSALQAAAVLIPSKLDKKNKGLGPWLLVAPDFGHLMVTSYSDIQVTGASDGERGSGSNSVSTGVDPHLRGQQWLEATGIKDFIAGKLSLKFCCSGPLSDGEKIKLVFHFSDINKPEGITTGLWQKIRRSYLNNWQPCGTWVAGWEGGAKKEMVLSNNVLSDPASISLYSYADPMIFFHHPGENIEMTGLLKHSLDYYLDNEVSAQGHVNAFGKMYDMYVSCGGSLIISAWDYYSLSKDKAWLG